MRAAGIVLLLALLTAGCKNKGDAANSPDPEAVKKQQELVARRDALMAARQKLQTEREKLDAEIKDAQAKGGDTTELVKKRSELDTQIESETSNLLSTLESGLSSIRATTDKSAQIAAREADVASRERGYATREEKIAAREADLNRREAELNKRQLETCSVSAAPVIIQAPKGGNYDKKEITGIVSKAKSLMGRKGLLTSDLPGPAQSLESDAMAAISGNDLNKAYIYAAQLLQNVEAITVNRAFIQAKTARLQNQVRERKLDDPQLSSILADVMQKYNDGDFGAANKRLNDLARKL